MPNGQNPQQYNNIGPDNPFMVYFKEFGTTYTPKRPVNEQELLEDFKQIASKRRKVAKFFLLLPLAIFAIFIPLVGYFIMIDSILLFCVLLGNILQNIKSVHGYTVSDYKNHIIQQALSPIVENLVYEEKIGVPKTAVKNMDITKMGNNYKTEDFISGKYHGVYFAQSDLDIWYSDDNDRSTTYFRGRWIDIKYPKPFNGMVTIVDKNYTYKVKKHKYLQKVTLENPDFNNCFIVESSNQQLAYYLLTPQIMERLMYLRQNSKGDIIACFMDGYLHIGINNYQNAFEPDIRHIDLHGDIEKTRYEFSLVSGLIEILNIDNNVYVDRQQTPQGGNMYPPQQNVQQPPYSYPPQRNIDRF